MNFESLIGLVGATGSGKTTLAQFLVDEHGYERVHMGGPIKDMLRALGIPEDHLTGSPEDRSVPLALLGGRSARYAMQTLGTGWGRRAVSTDIWSNAVTAVLDRMIDKPTKRIVIDDLRFPNDWNVIQVFGGTIVRVRRQNWGRKRGIRDHVVHALPQLHALARLVKMSVLHETEYHWHDAPASIEIANCGSTKNFLVTAERALQLSKLIR